MCGIFGHTNPQIEQMQRSRDALQTLSHRGPDQQGDWVDDKVYIGHRRLSILDLSANGNQPMVDDRQEIVVAANGEIYNFISLRKQLQQNYRFRSRSDTEVLLHGYREWGIKGLLNRVDGMYAFVIYDKRVGSLFLVRDRTGIKPLYYANLDDHLIWASELKAIVSFTTDTRLQVDETALYDFLTYKYVPTPKTLYRNVRKLEPGCYLHVDLHSREQVRKRYWRLAVQVQKRSLEEAADGLRQCLSRSVREQLISDVALGFFLSGGLDSSTLVAIACENVARVHTYTIGFREKDFDERHFALLVAKTCKTEHNERVLDENGVDHLFEHLRSWYDEPFGDTSAFPTFEVCRFARQQATVVLTGDGGDEVFGGYKRYMKFPRTLRRQVFSPELLRPLRRFIAEPQDGSFLGRLSRRIESDFLLNEFELYTRLLKGLTRREKQRYRKVLGIADDYDDYWYFRKYYRSDLPVRTRLQYLDFHTYLPDEMLVKLDRVSMAVSLEARVPFLARDVVEFCFSLDERTRYYGESLKGLLKFAYRDRLPRPIIEREKKGFSVPKDRWRATLSGRHGTPLESILVRQFEAELRSGASHSGASTVARSEHPAS